MAGGVGAGGGRTARACAQPPAGSAESDTEKPPEEAPPRASSAAATSNGDIPPPPLCPTAAKPTRPAPARGASNGHADADGGGNGGGGDGDGNAPSPPRPRPLNFSAYCKCARSRMRSTVPLTVRTSSLFPMVAALMLLVMCVTMMTLGTTLGLACLGGGGGGGGGGGMRSPRSSIFARVRTSNHRSFPVTGGAAAVLWRNATVAEAPPPPPRGALSMRPELHRRHVDELNRRFQVPLAVLERLPSETLVRLRRQLRLRGEETLLAAGPPRLLFLHCFGALGGRAEAVGSAAAYAASTDRQLLVLWELDGAESRPYERFFLAERADDAIFVNLPRSAGAQRGESTERPPPAALLPREGEDGWARRNTVQISAAGMSPQQLSDELRRHAVPWLSVYVVADRALGSAYSSPRPSLRKLERLRPSAEVLRAVGSSGDVARLGDAELAAALRGEFKLPGDFLRHMSLEHRRSLLEELRALSARPELAQQPAALSEPFAARCVIVHVQYGLGNRLRAMASVKAFARATNRVPVVIWERDAHMDAEYGALLANDEVVVPKLEQTWPFDTSRDENYEHVALLNMMWKDTAVVDTRHRLRWVPQHKHIYLKTAYVVQSAPPGSSLAARLRMLTNRHMHELVPRVDVLAELRRVDAAALGEAIGVHVRSKSVAEEIPYLDVVREYSARSWQVTQRYRDLTQADAFVHEIRRRDLRDGESAVFVAADDPAVISEIERKLGREVLHVARSCDGRDAACLKYALVDILCLSRTKLILGSHWSSFTEAAVRIGGRRVFLAGRDFNRPRKAPRRRPPPPR